MGTTEIDAIKKLLNFKNIDVRVYDANDSTIGLHAKTYIFKNNTFSKVIVGSSNITQKGLRINHEWNIEMEYDNNSIGLIQIEESFEKLWNSSKQFNESLFEKNIEFDQIIPNSNKKVIKNHLQEKALIELNNFRYEGENKAIAIAATGTGKTFLSAFDVEQFNPKRVLFLCHRWEILESAIKTFKVVFPNKKIELFKDIIPSNDSFVFCTVQTMSKV